MIRYACAPDAYQRLSTEQLRKSFHITNLFALGEVRLNYWETDRAVIGAAVPGDKSLKLEAVSELASDYFCERREMGILNIGGPGSVTVDQVEYPLDKLDGIYIGRGSRDINLASDDTQSPARFYLISYPSHAAHPTTVVRQADAREVKLGSPQTSNQRTIYQYIHEEGAASSQLVMGFTRLAEGSVWNTMPPHTHLRRSEVYLYFDIPDDAVVFHFMGTPRETRHLVMGSGEAVMSPAWSIHAGCGTQSYSFVWAMGGENQRFDDMDGVTIRDLK